MPQEIPSTFPDEAVESVEDQIELLTFSIGEQDYALDIMLVREIRNWSKPTPLPKAASYVRGVINLRGTVLPILDLAERLELESENRNERAVFVVIKAEERLFGIVVDSVSGILTVGATAIQEPPHMGEDDSDSCVRGLILEEHRLIRVLSVDRLAPWEQSASRDIEAA